MDPNLSSNASGLQIVEKELSQGLSGPSAPVLDEPATQTDLFAPETETEITPALEEHVVGEGDGPLNESELVDVFFLTFPSNLLLHFDLYSFMFGDDFEWVN